MKLIFYYLKKYKKLIFLALGLAAINQVFSLLDPQIFRLIIDNYASRVFELPSSDFIRGVILLLLASIGVALVSRIAKNFQDYYVNVITEKLGAKLYAKSIAHAFSLPYAVFEDQRSGELLRKMEKARLDAQTLIESSINILFLSLIGILFVLAYAFYVHLLIGLLYFLIIPSLGSVTYFVSRKIKIAQKAIVKQSAELAGSTTETLRNVELVKSLGLESQEIERLNLVNEKILNLELEKVKLVRKISFIQGTLINALRSLLLLLMLWLISQGSVTLGEFFSLLFYSFFIFNPLASLGTVATQYQEARASSEQLEQVLAMRSEAKPKNPIKLDSIHNIEYKDVNFHYKSSSHGSLHKINIIIESGETIGFVGPSGSGKTTMVKLLSGLYKPSSGQLKFNNIDSGKIDYDYIRSKIGLVSQSTQLFAGTIKENLLFVNPKANEKQCFKALRLSAAMSIVERGDKGLDTKIGEGGIKISGGERQRLAIARALLRNPQILVFDEATSSLDSITEQAIIETIQNIEKANPKLITILVAHRLSTVMYADRIYVLEKGRIIETGAHSELIKKDGLYHALWRQQIAS